MVRISIGRFDSDKTDEVQRLLQASEDSLRPAITALPGLVHYYVGLDRTTGTMTNTSVWDSREHATAMASLKAMLGLRSVFEDVGVDFESITNHEILWEL